MILLDSDVGVEILRGMPRAIRWLRSLPTEEQIILPGYVALELMHGLRNAQEAREFDQLLRLWTVVWIDVSASQQVLQLYRNICLKNAISGMDILIAKTALVLNLPLYTFNVKHFKSVPGLRTVQPYTR